MKFYTNSLKSIQLLIVIGLVLLLSACSHDPNSTQEVETQDPVIMGVGYQVVQLPLESNELIYQGTLVDDIDASSLTFNIGESEWQGDDIANGRQVEIQIDLPLIERGLDFRRDTLYAEIIKSGHLWQCDTLVVVRANPKIRSTYGDSVPVVDPQGRYLLTMGVSHPAKRPIQTLWLNGEESPENCQLDSLQQNLTCELQLIGASELITVIVEDTVGAQDTMSVLAYTSISTSRIFLSDSVVYLPITSSQYDLVALIPVSNNLQGYSLKSGSQSWSIESIIDSTNQIRAQLPLPNVNVNAEMRIDTLNLLLVNHRDTLHAVRLYVVRSRPSITLNITDTQWVEYPDTNLRVLATLSSPAGICIDSLWFQEELKATARIDLIYIEVIPIADSVSTLHVRAKDDAGGVTEKSVLILRRGVAGDTDHDSILNWEEVKLGFSARHQDSDFDGVLDRHEDRDGDGLTDIVEFRLGLNFNSTDTDGDGLSDYKELEIGTDPLIQDSDGDGSSDLLEFREGTNPLDSTVGGDRDGDGLSNERETILGTDPSKVDTDGDGLSDYQEVQIGTNPKVADSDSDGINDSTEVAQGLDPLNRDTDGDGIADGSDTNPAKSSDPRLAELIDDLVPGMDLMPTTLHVGDLWSAHMTGHDTKSIYSVIRGVGVNSDEMLAVMMGVGLRQVTWKVGQDTNTIVVGGLADNFEYVETVIGDGLLNISTAYQMTPRTPFTDIHEKLSFLSQLELRGAMFVSAQSVRSSTFDRIKLAVTDREIERGLSLMSPVSIDGLGIDEILHADSLLCHMQLPLPKNMADFKLYMSLDYDVVIAGDLRLKEAGVQLTKLDPGESLRMPKGMSVAIIGKAVLNMSREDSLQFEAGLRWLAQKEYGMFAQMTGGWNEPFGMPGVRIDSVAVDYKNGPKVGVSMGITGQIKIGSSFAKASFYQSENPLDKLIEAQFESLDLYDIINAASGLSVPSWWEEHVNLTIDTVRYYQAKSSVSIAGFGYDPGIHILANVHILGLDGRAEIQVEKLLGHAVSLEAQFETSPVIIMPGVAELTGKTNRQGPVVDAVLSPTVQRINIDAHALLLGVRADATMVADLSGIHMNVTGKIFDVFNANVTLRSNHSTEWLASNFNVQAVLQQDFNQYIDERVSDAINSATQSAQNTLRGHRNNVTAAQRRVDEQKAIFDDAQESVDDAQAEVDRLDGVIASKTATMNAKTTQYNDFKGCVPSGWSCIKDTCGDLSCETCPFGVCADPCWPAVQTCRAAITVGSAACTVSKWAFDCSYETAQAGILSGEIAALSLEIAGLHTARQTAWLALEAAKLALEAPKLALDAAILTLEGYKATLAGAVAALGVMGATADFIMEYGLPALLVIDSAGFSATLVDASDSNVTVSLTTNYRGNTKRFQVVIDFKNTSSCISSISDYLLEKAGSGVNPF